MPAMTSFITLIRLSDIFSDLCLQVCVVTIIVQVYNCILIIYLSLLKTLVSKLCSGINPTTTPIARNAYIPTV